MYKLNKLSKDELTKLTKLLESSVYANKQHLEYLKSVTNGLVDYHHKGKGNMKISHLSPNQNIPLTTFLENKLLINRKDIISIHLNEYHPGSEALLHKDSNSSKTILILLSSADVGGELLLEDEIIDFKTIGSVISYNGGDLLHGVSRIEKGFRKTLVVWVREKTSII